MAFTGVRPGPVDRGAFERFKASIDPVWIEEALSTTGKASVRKRRLPAEQVCWLVLGMALFRNLSIEEVVRQLDLALPGSSGGEVVPSAIAQARARLGADPMRWLFERTAAEWGHRSARKWAWRGLAVYGMDGTTIRVPDSEENRAHYGPTTARGGARGLSGYPLVRAVTLMALRSHLLVRASFGPYTSSEGAYAKDLWPIVPNDSLVVVDRNFFGAPSLIPLVRDGKNRHWLTRAKSNHTWTRVKKLGSGDELVAMTVSTHARAADPSLKTQSPWVIRAIRYKRRGFRPQTLLTSLTDHEAYPADEIIELYHERWEIELGFNEVKSEMLEREESIRSRKPGGVEQELWGLLLGYNLVRLEMERVAEEAAVMPTRISFVAALRLVRTTLLGLVFASPGVIPKRLAQLRADVAHFVLPERRTHRRYPRAVKLKMSSYDRKRPMGERRARRRPAK
ncbi:MAG: IS4 family transposase [Myxococcaceae bacterium]